MKSFSLHFLVIFALGQVVACSDSDNPPGQSPITQDADAGVLSDANVTSEAATLSDTQQASCLSEQFQFESKPIDPVVKFSKDSCTEEEMTRVASCLTTDECSDLTLSNRCNTCLEGDKSTGSKGALGPVGHKLNLQSCVEHLVPGAGQTWWDATTCPLQACKNCGDIISCINAVINTACKAQGDAYSQNVRDHGSKFAMCFPQEGEDDNAAAARVARFFCGP